MSAGTRVLALAAVVLVTACQSAIGSPTPAGSRATGAASPVATAPASPGYRTIAEVPQAPLELRMTGLRAPGSLALADGTAWIGTDLGVVGVDMATGEAVHSVDTGVLATVAAGGAGVWASSYLADAVSSIDPETGRVATSIQVPGPAGVAVGDDLVWVASPEEGDVSVIDAVAGSVVRTVEVEGAYGVAAAGGDAWVAGAGGMTRIGRDGSTETVALPAGYQPMSVLAGPEVVWIGAARGGTAGALLRLDVASGDFTTLPMQFGAAALPITGVATDGDSVFASGLVDLGNPAGLPGVLGRVDEETGTFGQLWRLPPGPLTVAVGDGLAWTTARHTEVVATRLDGAATSAREAEAPGIGEITAANAVPYTSEVACGSSPCAPVLDVLGSGDDARASTIVLLHGGPGPFDQRHYLSALGTALAARGSVVVVATYRSEATGNDRATAVADAACAVAWARENIDDYGGDPERVALVGHSYGGELTLEIALSGSEASDDCLADGPTRPDLAVPMAGFETSVAPADAPDGVPPLRLLVGSDDPVEATGEAMAAELVDAGLDATFESFEGIDHGRIVDPAPSVPTVERLVELIDALGPGATR